MIRTATILTALIQIAIATPACTALDGTDPYALWNTVEHTEGAFHFHYPSPPWQRVTAFDRDEPVLLLDPRPTDSEGPDPGARMRIHAWADQTSEPSAYYQWRADVWRNQGYEVEEAASCQNGAGDEGSLLEARGEDLRVAEVFYAGEERLVIISVWGTWDDNHDSDLWLLLDGFEPRGAKGE